MIRKLLTGFMMVGIFSCANDPNYLESGFPSFVRIDGNYAYVASGELGLDIIDLNSMEVVRRMLPQREMHSIDAFSIDGDLLFVIDARGEDYLAVYSLVDPTDPVLVSGPVGVNGGPFTGVSAAGGNVVVSGGTTHLNFYKYDGSGNLSKTESIFARDRGHPDVLLSSDGEVAYLSTDFNDIVDDAEFGIVTVGLDDLTRSPVLISELGIPESGFTTGTTRPTGFPIKTAVLNNHLLVAHGGGLSVIELIEGKALTNIQTYNFSIEATDIALFGTTAYLVGSFDSQALMVSVDLSDIDNPTVIESTPLNAASIPTSIAVNSNWIVIAAHEGGLITIAL